MVIRVIHWEMVYESLEAIGCLQAFFSSTARRGRPAFAITDNGTNFVAAEMELRNIWRLMDKSLIDIFGDYKRDHRQFNLP